MTSLANTLVALTSFAATAIRARFTRDGGKRFAMWAKCERDMRTTLARL
jgi:hypothetical protein